MLFIPDSPQDRQRAHEYLDYCFEKKFPVNVSKYSPKRTNRQNRYIHCMLGIVAVETGHTLEEVKIGIWKAMCCPDIFYLGEDKYGKHFKSSKDLTTSEMSVAISRWRFFCQTELGLYIGDINDEMFMTYCEQQIEKDKEFIEQ